MSSRVRLPLVNSMQIHSLCVDYGAERYHGSDGRRLHVLSYQVFSAILRENFALDLADLLMSDNDETLAEG